jgi:HEAT repeat protein
VEAALETLGAMGAAARAATPALVNALERGPWDVRARVATLLGELGELADPRAIDPLRQAIEHSPASAQATSARALAQFRGAARAAAPELERLATDHWSWPVRRAAADAAWALSGKPVEPRLPSCRIHQKNAAGRWPVEWNSKQLELLPIAEVATTVGSGPCADWTRPAIFRCATMSCRRSAFSATSSP